MSLGLLGKKIGMTQVFKQDGSFVPATVIQAGPCKVIQKKTMEKDQYNAVQVGFQPKRESRTSKPLNGHFKKHNATPMAFLHEFRLTQDESAKIEEGAELKVDLFEVGHRVDVIGTSKGRGFTGVIKRHRFHGADAAHGAHEYFRHGGSVGQHTFPGRIFKGMKMPGQYGNEQVTFQSLEIVEIDPTQNLIFVKGPVAGANGGYVVIQKGVKYLTRKAKQIQQIKKPLNPLKASKRAGGK